jgi:hypothetical protein
MCLDVLNSINRGWKTQAHPISIYFNRARFRNIYIGYFEFS